MSRNFHYALKLFFGLADGVILCHQNSKETEGIISIKLVHQLSIIVPYDRHDRSEIARRSLREGRPELPAINITSRLAKLSSEFVDYRD